MSGKGGRRGRDRSVRINITLPSTLRREMDRYAEDHPDQEVNWSRIAADAYRQFLDERSAEDREAQDSTPQMEFYYLT